MVIKNRNYWSILAKRVLGIVTEWTAIHQLKLMDN